MNEKEELLRKARQIVEFFEEGEKVKLNLDISLKDKKIALAQAITNAPLKHLVLKNIHYILKENYKEIRAIPFLTEEEKKIYDEFKKNSDLYMRFFDEILLKEWRDKNGN